MSEKNKVISAVTITQGGRHSWDYFNQYLVGVHVRGDMPTNNDLLLFLMNNRLIEEFGFVYDAELANRQDNPYQQTSVAQKLDMINNVHGHFEKDRFDSLILFIDLDYNKELNHFSIIEKINNKDNVKLKAFHSKSLELRDKRQDEIRKAREEIQRLEFIDKMGKSILSLNEREFEEIINYL